MTKTENIARRQADKSNAFTISVATHVFFLHIGSVHVGSANKLVREFDEL
jgi:hypothetical protein